MKFFTLKEGNNSIEMARISFGAGVFDNYDRRDEYFRWLDTYFENGGNVIDTARVYCDWCESGKDTSEKVVGEWLKYSGIKREDVIVVTKCAHPPLGNMVKNRLTEKDINSDIERSLELLGLESVDILFLHRDNSAALVDEVIDTLDGVKNDGKTRFIGASNWSTERITQANNYALTVNKTQFSVSQISYSLAVTTPKECGDETLVCMNQKEYEFYKSNNFPVMAFASQGKGFFSKYLAMDELTKKIQSRFYSNKNLKRAEVVKELCEEKDVSPAAIALAFITSQPMPTSAIIGMSSKEQLLDSLSMSDLALTESELERLNI